MRSRRNISAVEARLRTADALFRQEAAGRVAAAEDASANATLEAEGRGLGKAADEAAAQAFKQKQMAEG